MPRTTSGRGRPPQQDAVADETVVVRPHSTADVPYLRPSTTIAGPASATTRRIVREVGEDHADALRRLADR